jgi:hypothetical protein
MVRPFSCVPVTPDFADVPDQQEKVCTPSESVPPGKCPWQEPIRTRTYRNKSPISTVYFMVRVSCRAGSPARRGADAAKRARPGQRMDYFTHSWSRRMPYWRLYWKFPTRLETKSGCLLLYRNSHGA